MTLCIKVQVKQLPLCEIRVLGQNYVKLFVNVPLNQNDNFCNIAFQAIFGNLIFSEGLNLYWWLGTTFIISGTLLVASN